MPLQCLLRLESLFLLFRLIFYSETIELGCHQLNLFFHFSLLIQAHALNNKKEVIFFWGLVFRSAHFNVVIILLPRNFNKAHFFPIFFLFILFDYLLDRNSESLNWSGVLNTLV
jgi:hypothetical protein